MIFRIAILFLGLGIFWGLPVSVILIIRYTGKIRKNGKTRLSIIIQAITLPVASIPIIIMISLLT
jgi:ABC-type methionine transport system permease subunit